MKIALRCLLIKQYEKSWNNLFVNVELFLNTLTNAFSKISSFEVLYDVKFREFWYTDTHTIRLTSASVTLTLSSQIRKEFFVKQKFLHHCCTRNALEVLQHKSFVDLLSWSSAFDFYKYDSKRAIFDVDYQVWKKSFLQLLQKLNIWCSSTSEH